MKKIFQEKGVILIISTIILGVLLTLGAYFLTFTLTDSKISKSQIAGIQDYYLSEAGVNEAIWRLKNDSQWKSDFETPPGCYDWSANFSQTNNLLPNSSYQVKIQNSDCANGQIIATSTSNIANGKIAQRVVKTKVFKAIGSLTGSSVIFASGPSENININASLVNVYNGNLFANNNLSINLLSNVFVNDNSETEELEGKALAGNNLSVTSWSNLDSSARCAKNTCQGDCAPQGCPAGTTTMLKVDFNEDTSTSYKAKAIALQNSGQCSVLCNQMQCGNKCVYTQQEFADLLWQAGENGYLTLNNKITYVTGSIDVKGARFLEVNGALVAEGTISIGETECWTNKGHKDCGNDQITVSDPGEGIPSGILTTGKINFGFYSSYHTIEIVGLIYANDEIKIVSVPQIFRVTGGVIGRKVSIVSVWASINFYLDNTIIKEGIWAGSQPPGEEAPPYSPVVTIDHWEESY